MNVLDQQQIEKLQNIFKIFKLKGNPYIVIEKNVMFGIDEHFQSLSHLTLSDQDVVLSPVSCRIKDFTIESGWLIHNIHLYNYLTPMLEMYTFGWPDFSLLDDDIATKVYAMKSADNAMMIRYHLDDNIDKDYLISVSFGLFSIAKGDEVDNYVREYGDAIIMKSIIHKKKQKMDITTYHRFLNIRR